MSKKKQEQPSAEEPVENGAAADTAGDLRERIDMLEAALDKATAETQGVRDALAEEKADGLRLLAEFDTFRRRNAEAVRRARDEGTADVADKLLPVLDTLERAVDSVADATVKAGLSMVLRQVVQVFTSVGVEEIPAENVPFDPAVHNAIESLPAPSADAAGTVACVLQRGYKRGEKILRHALVRVYT
ncbi:MAG: nucleotide exchange factor GrpE [Clostridiales bacterium]|jgi:molecular chaperone GrpE|nr:nucleotide exchange factor GrpE [Clostridiales bacterium]